METWMMYALCGMLVMGLFGIFQKIEAESHMNRNGFIIYSNIGMILVGLLAGLYNNIIFELDWALLLFASIGQGLYIFILKLRLLCLDYMTSSTYFINYRIFVSILLIIIGQIIFSDIIAWKEYLGIFLGFIVFVLLIEKKNSDESLQDLKKGYIYLAISVLLASLIWIFTRYISVQDFSIALYALYSGIAGTIVAILSRGKDSMGEVFTIKSYKQALFLISSGLVFGSGIMFYLGAFRYGGDLAVVYKVLSYSLFFPIVFSIIYYKEPVTPKKIIAFALTVISIGLFI